MSNLESSGIARLAESKEKMDGAIAFYHLVAKTDIPALVAIGDATDVVSERFFAPVPKDQMKLWKTRAISIENVNRILAEFETDLLRETTVSNTSIFVRQSWRVVKGYAIILGHVGELTLIIAAALAVAQVKYGESFWKAFKGALKAAVSSSFQNYLVAQKRLNDELLAITKYIFEAAALGFIALIIDSMMAGYSVAKWAEHVAPVIRARDRAIAKLQAAAFPQRKGRVRRKKRSRRN